MKEEDIERIAQRVAEILHPHHYIRGLRELAKYLGIGLNKAQEIKMSGEIPYRTNGNRAIFDSVDVDKWAEQQKH